MIDVDWPGANETLTRRLIGEAISVLTSSSARLLSPTRLPRSRIMPGVSGIACSTSTLADGAGALPGCGGDCWANAGYDSAATVQARQNVLRDITTASSPGFGDELVDRDAVAMILVVGPDDERRQHHFLGIGLLAVLAGLKDRELDAIGERARLDFGLDDDSGALRLGEAEHHALFHRLVIARLDVAFRERAPAVRREVTPRRVQLFRIVVIIDIVWRRGPLYRPVEQLRIVDDRTVERRDRSGVMLAVDNEIFGRRRVGPDIGVVDHERRKRQRQPHDEAEAPIDERRLKVRVGQFSRDGGALVLHALQPAGSRRERERRAGRKLESCV